MPFIAKLSGARAAAGPDGACDQKRQPGIGRCRSGPCPRSPTGLVRLCRGPERCGRVGISPRAGFYLQHRKRLTRAQIVKVIGMAKERNGPLALALALALAGSWPGPAPGFGPARSAPRNVVIVVVDRSRSPNHNCVVDGGLAHVRTVVAYEQ
jgi:hypothetical protein